MNITRFLSVLPLFLLLGIIVGVGYFLGEMWGDAPTRADTPTPTLSIDTPVPTPINISSLTPTNTPPSVTVSPTLTPTPTLAPAPTLTPTNTPSTGPVSSISTSTPTHTPLVPTNTPTPLRISGTVTIGQLNVRWGPSMDYGFVSGVYKDNQVVILARGLGGFWLKIETPDGKIGWVVAEHIQTSGDITTLPLEIVPPPPSVTPESGPKNSFVLILRGQSVLDKLVPGEAREYNFLEEQKETVFIVMIEPNVIMNKTDHIQFFLYYTDAIGQVNIVGVGSHPPSDRDGDLGNGELVWRGGPLVSGTQYYLRIINNSTEDIEYCLATKDLYEWSCP